MRFDPTALQRIRAEQNLTQEQLAAAAGSTFSTISRLERGIVNPNFETVAKLADALAVSIDALLASNGEAVA